ncbi:MAG: DUF4278 domain-containing protein [Cyanosarcina radialis HA8281-LM2]|jgi:hypothetical protein|nr:DUF4278 domain-containing protein [Cyanosarcina radialis HA8281-LM2]
MKLTFRGNFYEASAPIEPDSTDLPQIKLVYRSNTYYYTPVPLETSEDFRTFVPTVTLIYRGNTYKRKIQTPKFDRIPLASNRRWHFE